MANSASMDSPVVDAEYLKEIDEARQDLRSLITKNQCAPIVLRLALLDATTYDAKTKTGGANGSIRNDKELNHTENNGLGKAIQLCDEVKNKHPKITYADLYQLAGVVAVEVIDGPSIDFVPGRKDSNTSPDEGRRPNENQGRQHWRDIFSRMGLSDKEIVALCRALALGRAHIETSGNDGASTKEPLKFDNSYFKELLNGKDEGRFKLPIDKDLVDDRELRLYVEKYAKDEKAFFKDYAESHKKLSELVFKTVSSKEQVAPSSSTEHKVEAKNNTVLVQSAMIVAITLAVVVLGYLFEVHRRSR